MAEDLILNESQESFCQEYLYDLNATQAYLRVYKEVTIKSARVLSCKLLANVSVYTRIRELIDDRNKRIMLSQDFVIYGLVDVANRCRQATPVLVFDPVERCMVQARADNGDPVWEFDSHGANKALELLGKHMGIFEKDNRQKTPDNSLLRVQIITPTEDDE